MATNDISKKIYDLYVEAGLITEERTPFEKWLTADEKVQKKLYDLGVDNGIFTEKTPFDKFSSLWDVKKKDGDSTAQEEVSGSVTQVQEDPGTSDISPQIQNDINTGAPQQGLLSSRLWSKRLFQKPRRRDRVYSVKEASLTGLKLGRTRRYPCLKT